MNAPILALTAAMVMIVAPAAAQEVTIEPVSFLSRDGKTKVVAYLFKPANASDKLPAIVMLTAAAAHIRASPTADMMRLRYRAATRRGGSSLRRTAMPR